MKTAVSLPDPVFEAAEQLAKRLRMSRSELYATAIARFVGEHRGHGVTELLNRIYGEHPEDARIDPVLAELQRRALARPET